MLEVLKYVLIFALIANLASPVINQFLCNIHESSKLKAEIKRQQYLKKLSVYEEYLKNAGYAMLNKDAESYNKLKSAEANVLMYVTQEQVEKVLNTTGFVHSALQEDGTSCTISANSALARLSAEFQKNLFNE